MGSQATSCPACGRSSADSVICDGCGRPLPASGAAAPGTGEYPDLGGKTRLPTAGHSQQAFAQPSAPALPQAPPPAQGKKPALRSEPPALLLPTGIEYILKSAFSIAFLVGLAICAALLILYQRQARSPASVIPRLAERYISALAAGDASTAYEFLSSGARARCSLDEFKRLRGGEIWTASDVKLAKLEDQAAVVSYRWSSSPAAPLTVFVFWIFENDRWAVPYNLKQLREVERAVKSNNPDLALLNSQEAVRINPRDPVARASSCESAFFRKLREQALPECRTALELAGRYSSNVSEDRLKNLGMLVAIMEKEP